jgi:hypothetical protein
MTQAPASVFKIPTKSPQNPHNRPEAALAERKAATAQPRAASRVAGIETRAATRGDGDVMELDLGITVYPPRDKGGRWRAVWHEDGERQQCDSVSQDKIGESQAAAFHGGAANMTRPGTDLIAWYLNPDRLPVAKRWSRKHADTQRRLCQRSAAPLIGAVTCQDITAGHTQRIVNAAPTAGEGNRVHRTLSALVGAGIKGGYLVNPVLAEVHWRWTWHSLRHVFCTTALFTWKLEPTDVSRMAGHANYRITLDMYVGTTVGVLDRARAATE